MVGNINDVIAKAEKITADLAKGKASEKKDEKKDEKKTESDAATPEEIVKMLQEIGATARQTEQKRAAEIKAKDTGDGEIRPGWSYPKEDQIQQKWANWDKLVSDQKHDLNKVFVDFFETVSKTQEL